MPTLSELTSGVFRDDAVAVGLAATITPSTHPHPRARIRSWIVARLRAAALLPDRIQPTRINPTALSGLPRVYAYTLTESDSEAFTEQSGRTIERPFIAALHVVLSNEGLAQAGIAMDDAIDAFAYVLERLTLLDVGRDPASGQILRFGGEAVSCDLGSTLIEPDHEAARPLLHARIDLRVRFHDELTVSGPFPALNVVHADWDLAEPDGQIDAQDTITIPQ